MAKLTGTSLRDRLIGTGGADQISGLANDDTLYGRAGNDTIDGGAGKDKLFGEAGNDTLNGGTGTGADTLDGGLGDDRLNGQGGNDMLLWGKGKDRYDGGSGSDTADFSKASSGFDIYLSFIGPSFPQGYGSASGDSFFGIENVICGAFADRVEGTSAANKLEGRNGNDTLSGYAGADVLLGGNGDDRLLPGEDAAADRIDGGAGIDSVEYSGSFTMAGVTIDLTTGAIGGGAAGDILLNIESVSGASLASNTIKVWKGGTASGGQQSDTLSGSSAAGAATTETLRGNGGVDTYVLHFDSGADIIQGFNADGILSIDDFLQVSGAEFGIAAIAVANVASGGATGASAPDQFVFDKATKVLYFDADGAGGADGIAIVTLLGVTADLTAGNFSVVA